jgi:hypothetical protein
MVTTPTARSEVTQGSNIRTPIVARIRALHDRLVRGEILAAAGKVHPVVDMRDHYLLIPAQRTKGREFPDLVVLAPWKGPYQAKLPIGGRVAVFALGNCTRRVGSNMRSPMPWE